MNSYEVTVVLPVESKDKEAMPAGRQVLTRLEKEIKEVGGTIDKTEEWGKRELAYAIKKHGGPVGGYREGVYHYFQVTVPGDKIGGINRFLETSEGVLRHLIVKSKFQSSNVKSSSKPKVKNAKSKKSKKVVKRKNGDKKS